MAKLFYLLQNSDKIAKEHSLTDVNAQRDIFDFTTLLMTEFDEGGKEGWRQIIDTKVPNVLETFQRV
jgi:hypothetical protein